MAMGVKRTDGHYAKKEGAPAPSLAQFRAFLCQVPRQVDGPYLSGWVVQLQTAVSPVQLGVSVTLKAVVPMSVVPWTLTTPAVDTLAELIQRVVPMLTAEIPVHPLLS
jgi:hypothetical protein